MVLDDLLQSRSVTPLFQTVVDLDRMGVAGYEALARGPAGPLHEPEAMFAAAREQDRLVELDWLCREVAVAAARARGLRHPLSLFINAEPEALLAAGARRVDAPRMIKAGDRREFLGAELRAGGRQVSEGAVIAPGRPCGTRTGPTRAPPGHRRRLPAAVRQSAHRPPSAREKGA